MARAVSRIMLLVFTLLLVGCDHATKHVAKELLSDGRPVTLARGVLDLSYAQNFDTAFSLTSNVHHPAKTIALVAVMALGAVALAAAWWQRRHSTTAVHVGFAFMVAGALGNLLDRAFRGYVVDFVHLHHWPVFNVADVLIVVGGLVLAYAALVRNFMQRRGASA